MEMDFIVRYGLLAYGDIDPDIPTGYGEGNVGEYVGTMQFVEREDWRESVENAREKMYARLE